MTTSALVLMLAVWVIVTGFMLKFLIAVIRKPMNKDHPEDGKPLHRS